MQSSRPTQPTLFACYRDSTAPGAYAAGMAGLLPGTEDVVANFGRKAACWTRSRPSVTASPGKAVTRALTVDDDVRSSDIGEAGASADPGLAGGSGVSYACAAGSDDARNVADYVGGANT